MNEIDERLEWARQIAVEAGRLTLKYFRQEQLDVERKADQSPVTIADRQAETLLSERIRSKFPTDGVIGEEFGETSGSTGYRWILDPIDGTKSFISGVPLYGTLVGVERDQQSLLGVIYIPGLDELVYAANGRGAWYSRSGGDPIPARVSDVQTLSDGLFVTSQVDTFEHRGAGAAFQRLQQAAYISRTWGDCYGYLLVVTGRATAMVDPAMAIWDAAALQPILQEAGGTFTDWQGQATIHHGEGIGTNAHVLDEVLAITRDYPRRDERRARNS